MGKRKEKKRKRRRPAPNAAAVTDPGLFEANLSDPIALLQDGEYEVLDALYAEPDGTRANPDTEIGRPEAGSSEDDASPF